MAKMGLRFKKASMVRNTCSCRYWKLKGILCAHVIYAIFFHKTNPDQFVSKWYLKDTFNKAYATVMQPIMRVLLLPDSNYPTIEPPKTVKKLEGQS